MTLVELEYPKIERIEGDDRYAKFACEPLPPGYGTTLGNSLRRVLLSSLPGAAITAARVRGVAHEFSTIPGVKEDVVQIVLNLKQIRLRSFSNEPVTLTIEKEGPGVATAADIATTSEIEIVNPDAPVATLEPEASLWMELTIETGRGFHSAERREGLPIGVIPIDALYSPVKKVNFAVESTRVGQVTNYDRLILEVWTDGTTTPDEAVAQGSNILVQQFSLFAGLTRSQAAIEQFEPAVADRRHAHRGPRPAAARLQLAQAPRHHQGRPAPSDPGRGAAPHAQLRQEVARRDQGAPRGAWSHRAAGTRRVRRGRDRHGDRGRGRERDGRG